MTEEKIYTGYIEKIKSNGDFVICIREGNAQTGVTFPAEAFPEDWWWLKKVKGIVDNEDN